MFQRQPKREPRREVWPLGSRQEHTIEHLLLRIRPLLDAVRLLNIAAQKHERTLGHLGHLHRVQRDVKRIPDIRLPRRVDLWLKGVPHDPVPILQQPITCQNRDSLAVVIVGERIIDFADRVRLARDRRPRQLNHRRIQGIVDHRRFPHIHLRMEPVVVSVDDIHRRRGEQHRVAAVGVAMIGCSNYQRPRAKCLPEVLLHIDEVVTLHIVVEPRLRIEPLLRSRRRLTAELHQWNRRVDRNLSDRSQLRNLLGRAMLRQPLVVHPGEFIEIKRRRRAIADVESVLVVDFNQSNRWIRRVFQLCIGIQMIEELLRVFLL